MSDDESRSPYGDDGSPVGIGKRTKCSFLSKTFKVELSYSAKVPLKSISLALNGHESDNSSQDALRVLDIILRQQAANRILTISAVPCVCLLYLYAKRILKNLRIKTTHNNMEFKIIGLSEKPCAEQYFPMKVKNGDTGEGQTVEITVYEYFTKHCGIELTFSANLPCLDVGKPKQPNYLPLEAVRSNEFDKDPVLSSCGISIGKELTKVNGRVLETPRLKVGNHEDCIPRNGQWNFNNKRLLDHKRIKNWIVFNFSARCDMSRISRDLINCARNKGIEMEHPVTFIEEDRRAAHASPAARVEAMFEQIRAKLPDPPGFILCVLPRGGINSLLAIEQPSNLPLIKDTPTLILGMDVSHGSPGLSDIPSIDAVVGSCYWPLISRYRASVRTQSPKVEMIDALYKPLPGGNKDYGIMRESLLDFYETSNCCKPKQIIVFRDGVNESQFNQVLNIELDEIIKAYQHLGEPDVPKFTVIVAQKNHHTKLFQANAPENVPPGTVVDKKIVHPRKYDFYMCAHAGMIGTSRPAHYHVLVNEIGFSPNELQNLIHSLSYVYQPNCHLNWQSLLAPICYAHLAAYQMGQFLKFDELSETCSAHMTCAGIIPIQDLPRLNQRVESSIVCREKDDR
ncbi:hypothetical protein PTKIN_Ptkin12aG0070900 [Pterospermum kingtungense]